jgi:flagellar biosynthesis protein FliQ
MTLIPKLLVVAGTLAVTFPWIIQTMVDFTVGLYSNIGRGVR